jgi:molybdopterin converting factor subunit 1
VRVEILYFAIIRERARRDRDTLELPKGARVREARIEIAARHPAAAPLLPQVQIAVNRTVVGDDHLLSEGDELALLPPVAGGAGGASRAGRSTCRPTAITAEAITIDDAVAAIAQPWQGAVVTFAGVVRRQGHHLPDVVRLEYEAYREMAEAVLQEIAAEIEREHPGTRVAIHHRTGSLAVGETAVAIAAAAAHRAPAFEACRAAIERVKQRAPIWKKEIGESGEAWLGLGP